MKPALAFFFALLLCALCATSLSAQTADSLPAASSLEGAAASIADSARPASPDTTKPVRRTIAYYFHTTARCASCLKIEAYSREALETGFAKEIARGDLEWRMVNIDQPEHAHFVKEYQLFTKSLVLVEETGGERGRWKNLPRVWSLLTDAPGFRRYVQEEARLFIGKQP